MQLISTLSLAVGLEAMKEPTQDHRNIARTLIAAGGHGKPAKPNRAQRRKQVALERQRASRGRVPA